ncbi:MAG: hypothetical protein ACYCT2_03955 [Thermoplasmataceae archaeon]
MENDWKYEPELRVFPNEKYDVGHYSLADRQEFLFGGMDPYDLRNRNGVYRVHTIPQVRRVSAGSYALFRFEDSIIGEGRISGEVSLLRKRDKYYFMGMQGYVVFDTSSLYAYKHKISVDELESITKKYPGKRNSWTRFDLSFLDSIRKIGEVEQDQGDLRELEKLQPTSFNNLLKKWIIKSARLKNLGLTYQSMIKKGVNEIMSYIIDGDYSEFKVWFRWILHGRSDLICGSLDMPEVRAALLLFSPYELQEFLGSDCFERATNYAPE